MGDYSTPDWYKRDLTMPISGEYDPIKDGPPLFICNGNHNGRGNNENPLIGLFQTDQLDGE